MKYLKLIRYPNILMIAVTQILIKVFLIDAFFTSNALSNFEFSLLVLATVSIAAGGYIINDIYDQQADEINKPKRRLVGKSITETQANNLFIALNCIGMGLGFYLSYSIEKFKLSLLFVFASGVLYLYANSLKKRILVGNFLIALNISLAIFIVPIYTLFPFVNPESSATFIPVFKLIGIYAIFAFWVNFLREIIKDAEDINGDYNTGISSLPIILGTARTSTLVGTITIIVAALLFILLYSQLYNQIGFVAYVLFTAVAGLLYTGIRCFGSKKQTDFKHISLLYKWVMVLGISSIPVLYFIVLKR